MCLCVYVCFHPKFLNTIYSDFIRILDIVVQTIRILLHSIPAVLFLI